MATQHLNDLQSLGQLSLNALSQTMVKACQECNDFEAAAKAPPLVAYMVREEQARKRRHEPWRDRQGTSAGTTDPKTKTVLRQKVAAQAGAQGEPADKTAAAE